ncbi:hypothetical protein GN244_ATG18239 [Phytophthora infestans]|uniref:Uncharacterized protein n=1 Tax=Phytophthora infestans TaxID=4787 RepID=A0A833SGA7_PHYIN|nr:hypothetical protein GN244_ATG18239 [Phytophthora infestans]KAF4137217.1 hypothetical protein GN958_ATG13593 [Phytophthora infestans]KAF4142653.1 hypothetical protein GN958_ATG08187 [Phytophthora infestans]
MTVGLTATKNILHQLYQHLVSEDEVPPLAVSLLDQRLVVCSSLRDATSGLVVRLDSILDMLTAILLLVSTLENAPSVFGHALIKLEGKFLSSL